MIEVQLLNSVLASRDSTALVRNGLMDRSQWLTHKEAYNYVVDHLKEYGELPSVNSMIENIDNFEAVESVESPDTLAKKLIERNVKNLEKEFFVNVAQKFGDYDAYDILKKMEEKVDELQKLSMRRGNNGIDWASSGEDRLAEYESRKQRDFARRVPFLFTDLTNLLGEMHGGFYETIMGFTSRGKTWLGLLQGLVAHKAGFKVLVESGEMSKPEVVFRLDTLAGGFSNRGLYTGALDFKSEEDYKTWLQEFRKDSGKAPFMIKTQEDWPQGLTLFQIEHDIQVNKPDLVIIDQFSLIRHTSSDRAGMTNTSRRLKELAGKYGIIICLLYQANGDYEKRKSQGESGDNCVKELVPPRLSDYSETIAIIQDSDVVLTFDSTTWIDEASKKQCGKALLSIGKSRAGGDGTEIDLNWIPNQGIIEPRKAVDLF